MKSEVFDRLSTLIKNYYDVVDMRERYSMDRYAVPIDSCPVDDSVKREIGSCNDNLLANLILKERLVKVMKNSAGNIDLNFWIINRWGNVRLGKSLKNQDRIMSFFANAEEGDNTDFSAIASFSKVMSFINPWKYFVYDSRVAYSLNWLMRKAGAKDGFFPIPQGQNKLAKECDLYKYLKDEFGKCFIKKSLAYGQYCSLIRNLCPEGEKPYKIEMLLFQIAPYEVYEAFRNEFDGTKYYKPRGTQVSKQGPVISIQEGVFSISNNEESLDRSSSHALSGYSFHFGKNVLYLYLGAYNTKKEVFCQVLTKRNMDSIFSKLSFLNEKGLEPKKDKKDKRYIRKFKLNQISEAEQLMESLKEPIARAIWGTDADKYLNP